MKLFRRGTKKLGIYVHIPFCRSKCEYCDFYSLGGSRDRRVTDEYLQALADHIAEAGKLAPDYEVDTVYFGGGTPSFFGAGGLNQILDEIMHRFHISADPEITLEANPDSINPTELRRLLRGGFNRISIGVQSDDDEMLRKLGRPHTFEQARLAVLRAREAGFANLSLDLMYGLPNQTPERWLQTLEHVLKLRPEHLSCYGLRVEQNTPLWEYQQEANLPSDDTQAQMYLDACAMLRDYGYEHYEISNFARPAFASRHNLKYWTGGEYLGFGPSAASDFTGKRFTIVRDLPGYIAGIREKGEVLSECEAIALRERAGEYVMLRLRISEGISAAEYERSFLMPFAPLEKLLERFAEKGLAERFGERWRLTEQGWLLSNRIIVALLEAQERSTPLTRRR